MESSLKGKIAIIGSGLIGQSWGTLFASAGYAVCLYDVDGNRVQKALQEVKENLKKLIDDGLSRGPGTLAEQCARISTSLDLAECLHGAIYAQESTLENVEQKTQVFQQMDNVCDKDTILASSTSAIPASRFTEQLKHRQNCLVAHPINPPLYTPLVEIVPTPWTAKDAVDRAYAIIVDIGQRPIRLEKEVLGFAANRLQYAIMAEAWRLVKDGVLSPEDVDAVIHEGIGLRYAFYGPLQVMHMNANGIRDYTDRYAAGIKPVLVEQTYVPTFVEPSTLDKVAECLETAMPIATLPRRQLWRQRRLAELNKLKKRLDEMEFAESQHLDAL